MHVMKVAVVGSGVSGLLASALLAKSGVDVVRYERASSTGGRARSPTLGGLPVNLGPRAVYRGGAFAGALASLGIKPTGFAPIGATTISVDGMLRNMPMKLGELLGDDWFDGADKRALALALARIAVGAMDVRAHDDVDGWLARHAGTPRVSAVLRMLMRVATYSNDGAHDARLALGNVRRALTKGVTYVDGGWASIVGALERVAPPAVTRRIESLDDVDADAVVVATSYDEACALVPRLQRAQKRTDVSCLDLVLQRLPDMQRRVAFGIDEPSYFSVHTKRDAPADAKVVVHAMWSTPVERAVLEAWVDRVQPGWRDVLVEARYLSRMTVSVVPTAREPRAPVHVDGERLYVVGDFVDSGHILADGAAASAVAAVNAIASRAARKAA